MTSKPAGEPPRSPPSPPFTVAIVGGGIGGVALAIGLAAQNVPFHIYEAAPSFGEIGAGVSFGPNVIRAIHGLSPAMLRAYAKHVTANEPEDLADVFTTYRKGFLYDDDDDDVVKNDYDDEEYRKWTPPVKFHLRSKVQEIDGTRFPVRCCVHRAHLLDEWVRLLPVGSATFGKTLVKIDDDDDSKEVVLTFSDGSTATASAVVGCDGIKSVTRKYLHGPDATAVYSGFFGYRAMAPRAAFEQALGPALAASGNLFLYRNGYAIAYPVDHGVTLNMFATCLHPKTKEEGSTTTTTTTTTTWEDAEWKVPSSEAELRRDLRGWHPAVVDLLARHGNGEKWAMFHAPHDERYYRGRVCIMGDAAHATTPHVGAGAGMAIEDAFVLSGLLGAVQGGGPEEIPGLLFEAYDAVRRPRSQRVVRESSENVARYRAVSWAEGEELERLRGEAFRLGEFLWDNDLGEDLAEAISIMKEDAGSKNRRPTA